MINDKKYFCLLCKMKLRKVLISVMVLVVFKERLKRILIMTRKSNIAMRKSNDNIDRKKVVIV